MMNPVFDDKTKTEIAINKVIGSRLHEARELCGWTQIVAAGQIGRVTPNELSLIESGRYKTTISPVIIKRAAEVYNVSTDFLFGFTVDWELDPIVREERDFLSHIQSILLHNQSKALSQLIVQQAQINELSRSHKKLIYSIMSIKYDNIDDLSISVQKARQAAQDAALSLFEQKLISKDDLLSTNEDVKLNTQQHQLLQKQFERFARWVKSNFGRPEAAQLTSRNIPGITYKQKNKVSHVNA